jgi:hypothetical protein
MELRLGGYFAKHIIAAPEWIDAAGVADVCSVSTCISRGPDDWVDRWLHNDLGLFDSPELALKVASPGAPPMTVFAYRISTVRFVKGARDTWAWPNISPIPVSASFRSLGFDAVSKYMDSVLGFECSPLSCNALARDWPVNQHCLLDSLERAVEAAERFSVEQREPGMYYVAEVLSS